MRTEIFVCLLIRPNFQNKTRHTVGKQQASVERSVVLFCMDRLETYPKSLTHRAVLELDPIPSLPKPRRNNWLAEGSQNHCRSQAHLPGSQGPMFTCNCHEDGAGETFHRLCTLSRSEEQIPVCLCCREDWKLLEWWDHGCAYLFPTCCNIQQNAGSWLGLGLGLGHPNSIHSH